MRRKNLIVLVLACVLSLTLAFSASAQVSSDYTGWDYNDYGDYVYYVDGVMVKNDWLDIEGETFYFGDDGAMYAGNVYEIDGDLYGFDWNGYLYVDTYFELYDYESEPVTVSRYCATDSGKLYINGWAEPAYLYVEENPCEDTFYAGADGKLLSGLQKIGDNYYYLGGEEYPARLEDGYYEFYDEANEWWNVYYAQEDGVLARNKWILHDAGDMTYWTYYADDCIRVHDCVINIGGKLYAFSGGGEMYYDTVGSIYNPETQDWDYYRAMGGDANGALLVNSWNQSYIEQGDPAWYYYGADGKMYRDGVYKIGGKYYYFHEYGSMAEEGSFEIGHYDEELDQWVVTNCYRAREDGSLYVNAWYVDGDYRCYYGADGNAASGLLTVDGKQYCFNEYGEVIIDDVATVRVGNGYKHYIVDASGNITEAKSGDWTKANGKWYLVLNNEFCVNGVYFVDGVYYAFDWNGAMYDGKFFELSVCDDDDVWIGWACYYAKPGGALACNEVIRANRYGYGSDDMYAFRDDCTLMNDYTGLCEIGGNTYYVYGDGNVVFDSYWDTEEGAYFFDENGICEELEDGWYYDNLNENYPEYWHWIYVQDGHMLVDGLYQIGNKRYAFDDSFGLITNTIYYDWQTEKYWLLSYMDEKGNGGSVCEETNVWKTVNGKYVYLTEDASLHEGWMDKFYLDPYMSYCEYIADDDGYIYAVNKYGVANKLTSTGLITVLDTNIYLKNGKVVTGEWIKLSDGWRYFDLSGRMLVNQISCIDDVYYAFDQNGRMCDKGWHLLDTSTWIWAAKSGALFTGIDSVGYVFDDSGRLIEDDVICIDDVFYVVNRDGKKVGTFTADGWNQVGGNWYYAKTEDYGTYYNKDVLRGGYYDQFGRFFAFDQQGKMLANRFYEDDNFYLGSNGNALKDWFKVDGYWYYGDPDDYGRLYRGSIYYIGEKEFAFDDEGKLLVNKTYFDWYEDSIITTNGNGEVTKRTPVNGWAYSEDAYGYGEAYYYKNGAPYTGWLGNYYIYEGRMSIDEIITIEETGKRYYLNKKGVKGASNWYELWEDEWVLARKDGSLYCNEWAKSGGKWYYFDEEYMVYDRVMTIDGKQHAFDENGVWLGEYSDKNGPDFSKKKDGWVQLNGKWYFSMAGEAVCNRTLLVDGKTYAFDYDGVMIANDFYFDYTGFEFGVKYFTAGGALGEYTGWKYIGKDWVYFNKAHVATEGWILDDGKYYYQEFVLEYGKYSSDIVGARMVTGYYIINDVLYYFNNGGALTKTITTSGWYQDGSDWYYVDANGKTVAAEGQYKIGGSRYAFDYDGKMIANDVFEGYYYNKYGALITKSGWYAIGNKWIYVLSNGKVASDGVFRIGGKDYYFSDDFWVE